MPLNRELEGRRVRLLHCGDPWAHLHPGECGTIRFVDDEGTLHVDWDTGSRLGLVPDEDRWVVLP